MTGETQGGAPAIPLPREMVLASAGAGKTYDLSSRLIGLLALGSPPESIWASTFTRKAAAEILDRVLLRLAHGALDDHAARELAGFAWFDPGSPPPVQFLDRKRCGELLSDLLRALFRTNVGTLDSFFIQVATAFSEELGLPPGWKLVEGPLEKRMRSEALEAVLKGDDSPVMAELVRILVRDEARRGVHDYLLDQVDELLQLDREIDPASHKPWIPVLEGIDLESGEPEQELEARCRTLAQVLEVIEPPANKDGSPNSLWANELQRLAEALGQRDWKGFLGKGLGLKLVETGHLVPAAEVRYSGHAPGPEVAEVLDAAVVIARIDVGRRLIRQGEALGRMAAKYRTAFEAVQMAQRRYRFSDVTYLLGKARLLGTSDPLYFRLDARIRHLLLDEFQDTSFPQWRVVEPLVDELLSGGETERAAVMVADPKQSIYGWRGARPGLVDLVQSQYGLNIRKLPRSYRSGPVVLETVAEVFRQLDANPVVQEMAGGHEVARAWTKDFFPQEASNPRQPGLARLVVGPRKVGGGGLQPDLLDFAADLVEELHGQEPRASLGVLVRGNAAVSYLIAALRGLGVPASGEGGTPLTDAQPVNALLALFRLADHPGHRLARYHVAQTPLGEVVGYTNHQAGAEANRLALGIRGRLLRDGYGKTLDQWVRELEPSCSELEMARLHQLVEMGFRWDPQRTLRPGDFVRLVEEQRVEDPSGARVRVMTVHQAKGLQFDVVLLPQLSQSLEGGGDRAPVLPLRDEDSGRIFRVYPATDQGTRALFPELGVAFAQGRAQGLRDEFSNLYVAMTRARYALHMVVPADGSRGPGTSKSFARVLRATLAPDEPAKTPGEILFQRGADDWFVGLSQTDFSGGASAPEGEGSPGEPNSKKEPPLGADPIPRPRLRTGSQRRSRNLARRSPSNLEGGGTVELAALLDLEVSPHARLRGSVVHAWFELLDWMEDGIPEEETLREIARGQLPGIPVERVDEWLADFRSWLYAPAIQEALTRASYAGEVRVEHEMPFVHRQPDGILHGFIDRLVILEEGGGVVGAEILDFKTDFMDVIDPDSVAAKVEYYRPQIEAYREAVAGLFGLEMGGVSGKLLFLRPGLVREV